MNLDKQTTPEGLDARGRYHLAETLGDAPETVISIHLLRLGLCRAYIFGDQGDFAATLIQPTQDPGELTAFGEDAPVLWTLLRRATGWWYVNVPASLVHELAAIMERELRCSVRLYGDVHHTLTQPSPSFENPAVRLLTPEDIALVEAAAEVRGPASEAHGPFSRMGSLPGRSSPANLRPSPSLPR